MHSETIPRPADLPRPRQAPSVVVTLQRSDSSEVRFKRPPDCPTRATIVREELAATPVVVSPSFFTETLSKQISVGEAARLSSMRTSGSAHWASRSSRWNCRPLSRARRAVAVMAA